MKTFFKVGLAIAALAIVAVPASAQFSSPVTVKNTTAQPVPAKDLNLVTATPVSFVNLFGIQPGIFGNQTGSYIVPAGQRLVINYVSAQCDLPGSGDAYAVVASDQAQVNSIRILGVFLPMHSVPYPAGGAGHQLSVGGNSTEILIDAGRVVVIEVNRTNGTETGNCFAGFSGYLIALP